MLHAAIAGVYLFLSGLIAGYYDNKAIYRRIPERLAAHPLLNKLLGKHRAWQLGHYVEHNLGALAGNFYFGLFLIAFMYTMPTGVAGFIRLAAARWRRRRSPGLAAQLARTAGEKHES